jgi:CRISPR-associated protein Csm1
MKIPMHHVVFAALMHDIGKVIQRSGAGDVPKYINKCRKSPQGGYLTYKHAMWTADFLDRNRLNLPDQGWDIIVELAGSHHCRDSWTMTNYDAYLDMLVQADRLSSSWDREDPPAEEDKSAHNPAKNYRNTPLYSVFSRVSLVAANEPRKHIYNIEKLTPKAAIPNPENELKDFSAEYKVLIDAFEADFIKICNYFNGFVDTSDFTEKHFPQFIDATDSLLKKYFWCVPANTMEPNPISSLYHHMRNCASITAALYANHHGDKDEKPFMIIAADMNGIQNYLYDLNPENSAKAGKLLRSRSFQIQMIMEMAAAKVVQKLGLCNSSIFSSHGGKWFMLANNSKRNHDILEELKREFNEELYEKYLATLSLNLNWECKIGLADLNKKHFLNTMQDCYDALEKEKHAKFASILKNSEGWQSDKFIVNNVDLFNDEICDFCKRRKSDEFSKENYVRYESSDEDSVRICKICLQEIKLGGNLTQEKHFKIHLGNEIDSYISFAGMHFSRATDYDLKNIQPNTQYFSLSEDHENLHIPVRHLATHVPVKDRRVCTFEEIAQNSHGLQANAILKGDVDNLGYMMSRAWLPDKEGKILCSITEFATFSFLMDYFFSAVLPDLQKSSYADSIYTIYSGGDDFCLVGAYDKIISFAEDLKQSFAGFCANNPDMHFSAGISLIHPKEPIKFAIRSTDIRLEAAKKVEGKNKLNLYETIVSWDKLPELLEFSLQLSEWLESGALKLQFLYRLLGYHQMYLETKKENTDLRNYLYDSLLNYDIRRNIQKIKNNVITNPEIVNTLKELTGISEEGSAMDYLRIPLSHTIYKNRKTIKGV